MIMRIRDGFGEFDHMSWHVAGQRDGSKWKWSLSPNGHGYSRYGTKRTIIAQ
jgi:hypothetical protein